MKELENKDKTKLDGKYDIPASGEKGYITTDDYVDGENRILYLSLVSTNENVSGSAVEFIPKYGARINKDATQKWQRSADLNDQEYFSLTNVYNQMELHANTEKKLSVGATLPLIDTQEPPPTANATAISFMTVPSSFIPMLTLTELIVMQIPILLLDMIDA